MRPKDCRVPQCVCVCVCEYLCEDVAMCALALSASTLMAPVETRKLRSN